MVTEQVEELPPAADSVQLCVPKSVLIVTVPVGLLEGPGPPPFTVTVQEMGWFTNTLLGLQFRPSEDCLRTMLTGVLPVLLEWSASPP
jgi:hypothetical protein